MARSVSIAFSTYNQERYVRDALASVLAQDHEGLQVVICDDGSDDATPTIITEMVADYDGPHDVVTILREHNDIRTALPTVLEPCDGDWIVIAHGDDISHPTRVRRLVGEADRLGVSMVTSNAVYIDEQGEATGYWRDPDLPSSAPGRASSAGCGPSSGPGALGRATPTAC